MPLIVYTATNRVNGKVYVGITMQPLASRMAQHKSRAGAGNRAFPNAITKYGMAGFEWKVVQECATPQELQAAECEWIRTLNSLADGGHGYNRTTGGGGTAGWRASLETRAKLSRVRRHRNAALGLGMRRQGQMFNPKFGTRHRPESIETIRESMRGKRNNVKLSEADLQTIAYRIQCGESQTAIAPDFGVNRATISYAMKRQGAMP